LADHTQALTRKFDLLDSNQGTAKHAYLILDPKGAIRHKQIGDGKVAFNVEEALTTLSSCKLPVFDQSSFEEDDQPPEEAPPPPPAAPLPEESDNDEKEEASNSKIEAVEEVKPESEVVPEVVPEVEAGGVKIVVTQATKEDLFEETEKPTIVEIKDDIAEDETPKEEIVATVAEEKVTETAIEEAITDEIPKVAETEVVVTEVAETVVEEEAVVEPEVAQDVPAVEVADDKKSVKSSGDEESIKHVDDDKVAAVAPTAVIDESIITSEANNIEFDEAEIAVTVVSDQVDATVEPSEKELSSEPEVVGEVNNVEFDETEIAVTVEKSAVKEPTNENVESVDVEVAIEEESTKEIMPAADPIEEVPTIDTKSVSEDSETSKNDEISTPATLEIEADHEPLIDNAGDKKEDVDPNEAPKEPQTMDSLKRELTMKRIAGETTNVEQEVAKPNEPVYDPKKKKPKKCCILM